MRYLTLLVLVLALPVLAEGPELVPVAGLVLDAATGEAIADATVTVEGHEPVTTDEHGEWRLAVPPTGDRPLRITVRAKGMAPTRVYRDVLNYQQAVRAPTAFLGPIRGQIHGRVMRADGSAVANAEVELKLPRANGGLCWPLRLHADAKGGFGPVPTAAGLVTISAHGAGAHQVKVERFIYPGRTAEERVDLVAPAIQEVEGQVIDVDGKPVSGATIGCRPTIDHETVTDEEGQFAWPVPIGGSCQIWFRKDGFDGRVRSPFLFCASDRGPFVLKREAEQDTTPKEDEPLKEFLEILLRVVDSESRPVPGAEVDIRFQLAPARGFTDTAGRASFRIARHLACGLVVSHPRYASYKCRFQILKSAQIDFGTIVLQRPQVKFDAVVVDEQGQGIPTACLVLRKRDDFDGRDARVIPADANGRIRSPSAYRATLMAPGRTSTYLRPAPTVGEKILLTKSLPLTGVVVNAAGHPIHYAGVRAQGGHTTVTDGLGRFRFDGLAPGKQVSLWVSSNLNWYRQVEETRVSATPGEDELKIVLED